VEILRRECAPAILLEHPHERQDWNG
jgi:hypothetical protein